jgi:hypothetical protein
VPALRLLLFRQHHEGVPLKAIAGPAHCLCSLSLLTVWARRPRTPPLWRATPLTPKTTMNGPKRMQRRCFGGKSHCTRHKGKQLQVTVSSHVPPHATCVFSFTSLPSWILTPALPPHARFSSPAEVTILRPCMIYGPRGRFLGAKFLLVPTLAKSFLGAVVGLVGGTRTNWIHAQDAARASGTELGAATGR